jgi:oligoribonuclease (3'-5' exoribonuclease)
MIDSIKRLKDEIKKLVKRKHCKVCGYYISFSNNHFDKDMENLLSKLSYKEIEAIFKKQLPARSE